MRWEIWLFALCISKTVLSWSFHSRHRQTLRRSPIVSEAAQSQDPPQLPQSKHSNNFPSEHYRKNKRLYTQLKVDESELKESHAIVQANLRKPKILAPAGGWAQLKAAVAAGADAVYFGCNQGLNARARAENFDLEELAGVMRFLHERGLEGYLCMNVLVFETELQEAQALVRRAARSAVDAIIVQDVGLAAAARRIAPGLPIHASTQMSVTDGSGAVFAARHLGAETVVVGRELSVDDIASVVDTLQSEAQQQQQQQQ